MIIGIGCDIVNHYITAQLHWESNACGLSRIFSANELKLYHSKKGIKFIAGRFAAKEAVLKCIGTGMVDGIALTEIEILQHENGKPLVKLDGNAKDAADNAGIKIFHISISHTEGFSLAYVIAENNQNFT